MTEIVERAVITAGDLRVELTAPRVTAAHKNALVGLANAEADSYSYLLYRETGEHAEQPKRGRVSVGGAVYERGNRGRPIDSFPARTPDGDDL